MKLDGRCVVLVLLFAVAHLAPDAQAQAGRRGEGSKPKPDLADFKYGPHERNVLDLWKAKSDKPTPLVVFIHGGGFQAGSKEALSPALLDGLLKNGVSVMAINYRLSPEVHFPAHYLDCGRAIQFARSKAAEWNIDPRRVGATGGSAGAGTSLWLGFHNDLADPKNADAVLRESTRLTCMAVQGAQSTYDPRLIKEWVGEAASKHPALKGFYGLTDDELDSANAHKLYEEASPINFLTADDPPVMLFYNEADKPLPPDAPPGAGIHHPNFGKKLKEKMDALKIECTLKHQDDYRGGSVNPQDDMVRFFVRHLSADKITSQK
jgi:acetyl esterase/lipase